jgi:hypothetical protein
VARLRGIRGWLEVAPATALRVERRSRPRRPRAAPAVGLAEALHPWQRAAWRSRVGSATLRALIVTAAALVPLALAARAGWLPAWLASVLALLAGLPVLAAAARPVPHDDVARLLDRDLGLDEQVATALAVSSGRGRGRPLEELLRTRAVQLAGGVHEWRVRRTPVHRDLVLLGGLAAAVAAVALVPVPTGSSSAPVRVAAPATPQPLPPPPAAHAPAVVQLRTAVVGGRPRVRLRAPAPPGPRASQAPAATDRRSSAPAPRASSQPPSRPTARGAPQHQNTNGSGTGSLVPRPSQASTGAGRKPPARSSSGGPGGGRTVHDVASPGVEKPPSGPTDNPYAIPGKSRTGQSRAGTVVNGEVAGAGFGSTSTAGSAPSKTRRRPAGSVPAGRQPITLVDLRPSRSARGVAIGAPTTARGARGATSQQGTGAAAYVAPDANAPALDLRGLFDAFYTLPRKGS